MTARILLGDAAERLRELPSGSVHCVVTSPSYWGLRKYRAGPQEMGSEATSQEHIGRLVAVFREVRRVLRDDGVCFINYGDAMPDGELTGLPERLVLALQADGWTWRSTIIWYKLAPMPEAVSGTRWERHRVKVGNLPLTRTQWQQKTYDEGNHRDVLWAPCPGCPACAANDGLVLRRGSWRPTRAWEPIFMLVKGSGYYGDGEAVRQWEGNGWHGSSFTGGRDQAVGAGRLGHGPRQEVSGANLRNVWVLPPEPCNWDFCLACGTFFEGQLRRAIKKHGAIRVCPCGASDAWVDHYAAFPSELPRRCIAASTSEKGVCPACGAPWARIMAHRSVYEGARRQDGDNAGATRGTGWKGGEKASPTAQTLGWAPTCSCAAGEPVQATVLDPFCGTGTSLLAADRLGRDAIGIDLSERYCALAEARLAADVPLLGTASAGPTAAQGGEEG